MKTRYIVVSVIICLLLLIGYQLFWLFRFHEEQDSEIRQKVQSAIENSDYGEMVIRAKKIDHSLSSYIYLGDDHENKKLIKSEHYIQHKKEYEIETRKYIYEVSNDLTRNKSTNKRFEIDSIKNPFNDLSHSLRASLHQTLDRMKLPDLKIFYDLLTRELSKQGIQQEIRITLLSHDGHILSEINGDKIKKSDSNSLFLLECCNNGLRYRIVIPSLVTIVYNRIVGIVIISVLIIIMLSAILWYLIRTINSMKELDEMKSDFTNNMTHELKTPIAISYAAIDSLINYSDVFDEQKKIQLYKITREGLSQLSELTEQILSMSMERRKNMSLSMDNIKIKPIIESTIQPFCINKKHFKYTIEVLPEDAVVYADKQHLQHIISNLIDNAIKYSRNDLHIYIKAKNNEMSISDNGIGISSSNIPYIYDKFYRVPNNNRHDVKGYGLGLYYVKQIMNKMKGDIVVESELGKGTTFTLFFKNKS